MDLSEVVSLTKSRTPEPDNQLRSLGKDSYIDPEDEGKTKRFEELCKFANSGNWTKLEQLLKKQEYIDCLSCKNSEGETVLHIAADKSNSQCVRILIEAGAEINVTNNDGRLPLHLVLDGGCRCEKCTNLNSECVQHLLDAGSEINFEDKNNETPLHFSAKYMMPNCATILLENGADINRHSKGKNIGFLLVQKIPEVMTGELDKGILFDEQDTSCLKLDFKVILQSGDEPVTEVVSTRKETDLLNYMLRAHKSGKEALLTHPLTEAFLHLKWISVQKWFLMIRVLYYLVAILYTVFIFNVYIINCGYDPEDEDEDDSTTTTEDPVSMLSRTVLPYPMKFMKIHKQRSVSENVECEPTTAMITMGVVVALCTVFMVINELYEISHSRLEYFFIGLNYGWWLMIACVSLTLPPAFGLDIRLWQYPVAAFGVFYAWGMTLVQIGRVPRLGIYVEMLGKVLKDFALFLFTYLSLLLGFAFGFCVLFPHNEMFEYNHIPLSLMKVLLIMIGESDYEGLFEEEENPRVNNLQYSIPAHIIFAGFIIVVTIVLMNLLLGLAVSDIQELQNTAALLKVTRQIQQIALFESLIYSKFLPESISKWAITSFSVISLSATEGTFFRFSPTDPDDRSLPETLKAKFVPYLTSSPCLNRKKWWRLNRQEKRKLGETEQPKIETPQTGQEDQNKLKEQLNNLEKLITQMHTRMEELHKKYENMQQDR